MPLLVLGPALSISSGERTMVNRYHGSEGWEGGWLLWSGAWAPFAVRSREMTPKCWTGLVSSNEHWSERELERWPLRDRLTQGIKRCFARTHQRKVVALS